MVLSASEKKKKNKLICDNLNRRFIESLKMEKTSKIIESNHKIEYKHLA